MFHKNIDHNILYKVAEHTLYLRCTGNIVLYTDMPQEQARDDEHLKEKLDKSIQPLSILKKLEKVGVKVGVASFIFKDLK